MILQILTLLGAIALAIYGMELLSTGIQKSAGDKLRRFERGMTSGSPVRQVLSGVGITAVVQSSRATTIMVVSLVNAAVLSLVQGITVIMGTNIGTTITPWILGLLGFHTNLIALGFTLLGIGFVISLTHRTWFRSLGQAVMGLAMVFIGLIYMKSSLGALESLTGIETAMVGLTGHGTGSVGIFLLLGILLSFLLQSSSVAVILTMILVSLGWIPVALGAAMVLGENIGTTIYPNIVARSASVPARRAALFHSIFNVLGAAIVLLFFQHFVAINTGFIGLFGLDASLSVILSISLAHTLFNFLAMCLLIGFRKPIARLLVHAVKESEAQPENVHLKYIRSAMIETPSISIEQAYKETVHFAAVAWDGFKHVRQALNEADPDRFEEYREQLVKCEEITDRFEYDIAQFLNKLTTHSLNEEEAREVKMIYRIIGELESLGDSCENISRLLNRLRVHELSFDAELTGKLNGLVDLVDEAFSVMLTNLRLAADGNLKDIENAGKAEDAINDARNLLRDEGIQQIEKHSENYLSLNYFLDMLSELEAMGDFMINVSQSVMGVFDSKS